MAPGTTYIGITEDLEIEVFKTKANACDSECLYVVKFSRNYEGPPSSCIFTAELIKNERANGLNGWKIVRMGVKPYYNRFKLYITVVDPRKESATWESTGSQEGYWDAHKAGYAQRLLRWFEANSCFAGLRAMKKYNDMTRKER